MFRFSILAAGFIAASLIPAHARPTIEEYAARPEYSGADLSPDGTMLSVAHRIDGEEFLCILDIAEVTERCIANMGILRNVVTHFLTNEVVVVFAPEWTGYVEGNYQRQTTNAFAVYLDDGEMIPLPDRARGMARQRGQGDIIAFDPEEEVVYMPLYSNSGAGGLSVFEVALRDGEGRRLVDGDRYTIDWFVNAQGEPYARENYDDFEDIYWIDVPDGDGWRTIYQSEERLIPFSVSAVTADGQSLVFRRNENPDEYRGIFYMSLTDGAITGPHFVENERQVGAVWTDDYQTFIGVSYSGIQPSYDMLDEGLDAALVQILDFFPYASVGLYKLSADGNRILVQVTGDIYSGTYFVYDVSRGSFVFSLARRPVIGREDMALVDFIEYGADDGLWISALLTFPPGYDLTNAENLPTVVMPHGGPESYDSIGYDWMAQALANNGYLVFQPNFRGSSGFGVSFAYAGRGEWGRAMQDDITKGVEILASQGWSDQERVCIAGWSYGGYAALAGGAFTAELYKCVVSIAGVSDLYYFLENIRRDRGDDSGSYIYWFEQFGENGTRTADLLPISPYYHADAFQAPVLLMHGMDDSIVPIRESERMEDALDDAHADVRLIKFPRRGHAILEEEDQEEVLREMLTFFDQHIGGE
ncbi:prolyl oligopeptidase family serine peptidase [Ponticaulis sp.]|uniref:alpha/beta hydrolase family protein n=1 Tax=Ponticaulis sp. TaxID=2020902 RepID=UPI0025EB920D|nr:prolyl oligopeptidase family serine peptidase [Ponticaulis sp.]|tara:strand:+ start:164686 stop:166620 length:1935 start_codon:yes stop_codon:yes gene_type:complete